MKTFINPEDGAIWEFDDDVLDVFALPRTPSALVPYTRPAPTAAELAAQDWSIYVNSARTALNASDITILRCWEADVQVPAEWRKYRAELRAIISATSGDATAALPNRPAYPAGT